MRFQVHGESSGTRGFRNGFSVNCMHLITEGACFSKYEASFLHLGNTEVFNPSLSFRGRVERKRCVSVYECVEYLCVCTCMGVCL